MFIYCITNIKFTLLFDHMSVSQQQSMFIQLCKDGNIMNAKRSYNLCKINIHANNEEAFTYSCIYGRIDIAKWIYSIGKKEKEINIHVLDDFPFRSACAKGHYNLAKWLYSLGGIKIHSGNEYAFRMACDGGHFGIVDWLYSLGKKEGKIDIHIWDDEPFRKSCLSNLKIAQWLYSISDSNERKKMCSYNNEFLEFCCENGNTNVIE